MKISNDDVYSETFYHFVWTTKSRDGYIDEVIESELYQYIRTKCEQLRAVVLAIGGMPDHIHVACTFPNTLSISEFMGRIKGSSSHFLTHHPTNARPFAWRPGYGVLTFAKAELPRIVRYIEGQKVHHAAHSIHAKLERSQQPR